MSLYTIAWQADFLRDELLFVLLLEKLTVSFVKISNTTWAVESKYPENKILIALKTHLPPKDTISIEPLFRRPSGSFPAQIQKWFNNYFSIPEKLSQTLIKKVTPSLNYSQNPQIKNFLCSGTFSHTDTGPVEILEQISKRYGEESRNIAEQNFFYLQSTASSQIAQHIGANIINAASQGSFVYLCPLKAF